MLCQETWFLKPTLFALAGYICPGPQMECFIIIHYWFLLTEDATDWKLHLLHVGFSAHPPRPTDFPSLSVSGVHCPTQSLCTVWRFFCTHSSCLKSQWKLWPGELFFTDISCVPIMPISHSHSCLISPNWTVAMCSIKGSPRRAFGNFGWSRKYRNGMCN